MALKPPMQGLLDRTSWGGIPSLYQNPTSGIGGVVSNLWWGDLMVNTPNSSSSTTPPYADAIGTTNFNLDLVAIEGSNVGGGSMAQLLADMNGVENGGHLVAGVNTPNSAKKLAAGSQVKIRMFTNVGAQGSFENPPTPNWLVTQTGFFLSNDPYTATNVHPYWVSGNLGNQQNHGDLVVSPVNGLQYTCTKTGGIATGSNTTDPSLSGNWTIINADHGAPGYGKGAGPCCTWFGPSHTVYLAAYAYWQLLMANTRVFVTTPSYTTAGQGGSWYAGPLPQTIGGVTYSVANANCTAFTLDTCPLIGEVTMSACTTIYGECTIRQISSNTWPPAQYLTVTNASFVAAGYTAYTGLATGHTHYDGTSGSLGNGKLPGTSPGPAPDSDLGVLFACQQACATAWANTCISEAHNPFQMQQNAGSPGGTSTPATSALITNLTHVCEPGQALPGNNSPDGVDGYDGGIMTLVAAAGAPVYFQTQNASGQPPNGFGTKTLADVIVQCEQVGAHNIELPGGYGSLFGSGSAGPTAAAALASTLAGYISAGTGPSGHTTTFANGTTLNSAVAYSTANTRAQSGGPTFTTVTVPSTATVGTAYSGSFVCGGSPTSFAVTSGSLPHNLSIDPTTGAITGTPDTGGPSSFVVTARGAGGSQTSPVLGINVTVVSGAPAFTADDPPDGVLGATYTSYPFGVTPAATSWAVVPSSPNWFTFTGLPPGLTLNSSGDITGAPWGIPATWTFTVVATNSSGSTTTPSITMNITAPDLILPTGVAGVYSGGAWQPKRVSKV